MNGRYGQPGGMRGFGGGLAGPVPRDLWWLLGSVLATFSLQFFSGTAWLPAVLRLTPAIWRLGFLWQLVTYPFVGTGAPDIWFLVSLLIVFLFGRDTFYQLGRRRFWKLIVQTSSVAALAAVAVALVGIWLTGAPPGRNLFVLVQGQHMLLTVLIAAFATLNREATILLFFVLPIRARWFLGLEILFGFMGYLGTGDLAGFVGICVAVGYTFGHLTAWRRQDWLRKLRLRFDYLLARWRLARLKQNRGFTVLPGGKEGPDDEEETPGRALAPLIPTGIFHSFGWVESSACRRRGRTRGRARPAAHLQPIRSSESSTLTRPDPEPQPNHVRKQGTMSDTLTLPVLPLRDTVVFPGVPTPIGAGRPGTLKAIQAVGTKEDKLVFAVSQRENMEKVTVKRLHTIGTVARIGQLQRVTGGVQFLLQGEFRGIALRIGDHADGYLEAVVRRAEEMSASRRDQHGVPGTPAGGSREGCGAGAEGRLPRGGRESRAGQRRRARTPGRSGRELSRDTRMPRAPDPARDALHGGAAATGADSDPASDRVFSTRRTTSRPGSRGSWATGNGKWCCGNSSRRSRKSSGEVDGGDDGLSQLKKTLDSLRSYPMRPEKRSIGSSIASAG